jgi:hypothetical protein
MPRPRTNPDKHRKNVALTIEPELLMRCRALAAQKGRSLSQLVDQLLRDWLLKVGPSDSEIEHAIAEFIEGHEQKLSQRDARKPAKAAKMTR